MPKVNKPRPFRPQQMLELPRRPHEMGKRVMEEGLAFVRAFRLHNPGYFKWLKLRNPADDEKLASAVRDVYDTRGASREVAVAHLRSLVKDRRIYHLRNAVTAFKKFDWRPLDAHACNCMSRDWQKRLSRGEMWAISSIWETMASKATLSAQELAQLFSGELPWCSLGAGIAGELSRKDNLSEIAVLVLAHFTR